MKSVHFLTVVWGEAFVRTYLDLVLAAQLAPGNLPAFADVPGSLYKIYTTAEDAPFLRADPRVAEAGRHLPVRIIEFAPSRAGLKFESAMAQLARGIAEAHPENAAVSFLPPDVIFATGSFAALRRLHQAGKRLVMVLTPRARLATLPTALRQVVTPAADGALAVPARLLMRLALANLHPVSETLLCDGPQHSTHPSHLYWWVRREPPRALLAHCFHVHPLLVDPVRQDIQVNDSVDGEYMHNVCPDPRTHHLVSDSDELAGVELSRDGHLATLGQPGSLKADDVVQWSHYHCNPTHLAFFRQPVVLHDGPPPSCGEVEKVSRPMVQYLTAKIADYQRALDPPRSSTLLQSWRGWLGEHAVDLLRPHWCFDLGYTYRLQACWPSDLVVIEGRLEGFTPVKLLAEWSGQPLDETTIHPGHFRWVVPARLAYHPTLRLLTEPALPNHQLIIGSVRIWRSVLHRIRHEYRPGRAAPAWIEWTGLQSGHVIADHCSARVFPQLGLISLSLEVQSMDDDRQPGARSSHTWLLDAAHPGATLSIHLPGRHRLLSVSGREKRFRRCWKELVQIPYFLAKPLLSRIQPASS